MKIAIQGHPTRGKEVIQILESLGGKNVEGLSGTYESFYYIDDKNEIGDDHKKNFPPTYKLYTLEEFEKEFPFKIGDKVKHISSIGIIKEYCYVNNEPAYKVEGIELGIVVIILAKMLKPYKEMKEERNITLTLDKAKEWYKKGGELREIALQAYSEEELTKVDLPRSWKEFCKNYPKQKCETYIGIFSTIESYGSISDRNHIQDKNVCPSGKSAEAHLAMIQLEQLRDCYNNNSEAWGWSYSIIKRCGIPELVRDCDHDTFLRFNNETVAKEFLKNFRDLIEKTGDLI